MGKTVKSPIVTCPLKNRGRLVVWLEDQNGQPLPKYTVVIEDTDGNILSQKTKVNKHKAPKNTSYADFGKVKAGEYRVYVEGARVIESHTATVTVTANNKNSPTIPQAGLLLGFNTATPKIVFDEDEVVINPEQPPSVAVTLSVNQTYPPMAYFGDGTLTRANDNIKLYKNAECTEELTFTQKRLTIKNDELLKGPTYHATGLVEGECELTLELVSTRNKYITVGNKTKASITAVAINLVTPSLVVEKDELGTTSLWAQENPVKVTVGLTQTSTARPYTGDVLLKPESGLVEVYSDDQYDNKVDLQDGAVNIPASALEGGKTVTYYILGLSGGDENLSATVGGQPSGTLQVAAPAKAKVTLKPTNVVTPYLKLEGDKVLTEPQAKQQGGQQQGGQQQGGQQGQEEKKAEPVPLKLQVKQTAAKPAYTGDGTLVRANENVDIYKDKPCTQKVAFSNNSAPITNAELTADPPTTYYVTGAAEGACELTLKPAEAKDPYIIAGGEAKGTITVEEINRVTPTLVVEKGELGTTSLWAKENPVKVTVGLTQTSTVRPYTGDVLLKPESGLVEVYSDDQYDNKVDLQDGAVNIPASALEGGKTVTYYILGLSGGDENLSATVGGQSSGALQVAAPAKAKVTVKPTNAVTPVMKWEYKLVPIECQQYKKQPHGQTPLRTDPVLVQLSVTQSDQNVAPWQGQVELDFHANRLQMFRDKACTQPVWPSGPNTLAHGELTGPQPLTLYVRGVAFSAREDDVTMKVDGAPGAQQVFDKPAKETIGVPSVFLAACTPDVKEIARIRVDPDQDPVADYHTALASAAFPDQKWLSEKKRANRGAVVHVEDGVHHSRAQLILPEANGTGWISEADDYLLTIVQTRNGTGEVVVYDAEWGGSLVPLPIKTKVADLKAKKEYWVAGKAESDAVGDVLLELSLDRPTDGDIPKSPKRNVDWARYTVVKIDTVTMTVTDVANRPKLWDDVNKRFFINLASDPAGRKLRTSNSLGRDIKVRAKLTKPLEDITIHFMLVPDKKNWTKAHWGNDLPNTWKYKDIKQSVKHKDKQRPNHLLHFATDTDNSGTALMDKLVLSRFGGDVFSIGAYIAQDAHLAKYVDGHAQLGSKKPAMSDPFTLWRRVSVQITKDQAMNLHVRDQAVASFERAFLAMEEITPKDFDVNILPNITSHPEWLFSRNPADTDQVVCMGSHNKAIFYNMITAQTKATKPKAHLVMCQRQWDPVIGSLEVFSATSNNSSHLYIDATTNEAYGVFIPRLAGTMLVDPSVSFWQWTDSHAVVHEGAFNDASFSVTPNRDSCSRVNVAIPPTCGASCPCGNPGSAIAPTVGNPAHVQFRLVAAKGPYAGESGSAGSPNCLIVADPNIDEFNGTIVHEIGHLFNQVWDTGNSLKGLPPHPLLYEDRGGVGPHCAKDSNEHATDVDANGDKEYENGTCVMFHQGANIEFCDNCLADIRLRDLSYFCK